jgi:hypothetical protein
VDIFGCRLSVSFRKISWIIRLLIGSGRLSNCMGAPRVILRLPTNLDSEQPVSRGRVLFCLFYAGSRSKSVFHGGARFGMIFSVPSLKMNFNPSGSFSNETGCGSGFFLRSSMRVKRPYTICRELDIINSLPLSRQFHHRRSGLITQVCYYLYIHNRMRRLGEIVQVGDLTRISR